MGQPTAVAFTASTDAWPRAKETEIGAALCAIGRGKGLYFESKIVSYAKVVRASSYDEP